MLRLPSRRRKGSVARRQSFYRPRVESMEDRLLMAVITVTSTGDAINATDGTVTLREAITAANDKPTSAMRRRRGLWGRHHRLRHSRPGRADDRADLAAAGDHRPADDRRLYPAGVRPQHQPVRPGIERHAFDRARGHRCRHIGGGAEPGRGLGRQQDRRAGDQSVQRRWHSRCIERQHGRGQLRRDRPHRERRPWAMGRGSTSSA